MTEKMAGADNAPIQNCSNCGHPLEPSMLFCPACSQKVDSTRYTLRVVFAEFFETIFNLDSRFFKTLRFLFIPGYLTTEFFNGKHVSYFRPFRLFFTTLLVLYAVLGILYFGNLQKSIDKNLGTGDYLAGRRAVALIDTAKVRIGYDSLATDEKILVDTLRAAVSPANSTFSITMQTDADKDSLITLNLEDIFELEIDSIYAKYGIEGFRARLMTLQIIRARKDPGRAVLSMVTNTSWMILALMPALALVMKLLYLRRKRFYLEHLVFLFHYHATAFVVLILYSAMYAWLPSWSMWVVSLGCLGFLLFALKRYYRQSWLKTVVKYSGLLVMYAFTLFIFFWLTALVSLLIYR